MWPCGFGKQEANRSIYTASQALSTKGGHIVKRREFLGGATAAAALMQSNQIHAAQAAGAGSAKSMGNETNTRQSASRIPRVTHPGTMKGEMLHRELGATGEQVSVIGLGGLIAASTFSTTPGTITKAAAKSASAKLSRKAGTVRRRS
jgi:hypothetical protein